MAEYDWSILEAHPASDVALMSPELEALVEQSVYPRELIDRALVARVDRGMIAAWCEHGQPPPEHLEPWLEQQEKLLTGSLRTRAATWADDDLIIDLCANSPETVGDWSVTVERSPNPYAQYRLQERAHLTLLEDRRIGLGVSASSVRNTYIGGERTSVHFMSGWRVRDGFRGMGLSGVLRMAPGPGVGWFGLVSYWLVRSDNASAGWIAMVESEMKDRPDEWAVDLDHLTATIYVYEAGDRAAESAGGPNVNIRATEPADLDRCLELINRTHDGLDLFRPYSREHLEERLDDPHWGPKPSFVPSTYTWHDHRVVEVDGEIVACGGLWDRGRDIREVWRKGDAERIVDPTALMDFGHADSDAGVGALAALIGSFVSESSERGRSGLMAPLEFCPQVREALADMSSYADTRELHVMPFTEPGLQLDLAITKPYTDLAYW